MKPLTQAEEQIMQCLWKLKKAFLKDIIEALPEPKPAYTTVSTVLRVLVKKGFVDFDRFGKINQYFPLISKESYSQSTFQKMLEKYFGNSTSVFTSFFAKHEKVSLEDLEEMKRIIEQQIEEKKKK